MKDNFENKREMTEYLSNCRQLIIYVFCFAYRAVRYVRFSYLRFQQVAKDAYRSLLIVTPLEETPTVQESELMTELKQRSKSQYNYTYKIDESVNALYSVSEHKRP